MPVNGKLPMKPMPMSPEMESPATWPVNSSVSGIGLVIETFQDTLSPSTVPSKSKPGIGVVHEQWGATNQKGELVMTAKGINMVRRKPA